MEWRLERNGGPRAGAPLQVPPSRRRLVDADYRAVVVVFARRLAERADQLLERRLVEVGLQSEVAQNLPRWRLALVDFDRCQL